MTPEVLADSLRPWLRTEHAPAFEAALAWVMPRCRTEEERLLAPALLLLLAPLNALVVPCRQVEGSGVAFQVTVSREGAAGPERVRLNVRAGSLPPATRCEDSVPDLQGPPPELWLEAAAVTGDPLGSAARVLAELLSAQPHR